MKQERSVNSLGTIILCLLLLGDMAGAVDFHVAPNGSDASADGPLATLHAARDAARKLGVEKPRRIAVHAGRYFLTESLVLDGRDSGLTIEAAGDGKVILYGGKRMTEWEKDGDTFWSAKAPEAVGRKWDFRLLVANGRFCKRARYPKEGFLEHLTEFKVPWLSTTAGGWQRKPTKEELTTMKYKPEDLGPWLNTNNAELTVYHKWDESMVGIASIDRESHAITFSNATTYPPGAFGRKRYVVWNVREGMTEPGQWYLDRTAGKLVYWPLPGEDMAKAEVIAPTTQCIISLWGKPDAPVRNVTVRGLTFSVTDTPLRAGGFGASAMQGALVAQEAENCALTNLTFVNVGGWGVKAQKSKAIQVVGCEVHHTGAGGIRLQGDEMVASGNHVHDIGLISPSGVGISCGGNHNLISHNEIHDTPYSAVTCGRDDNRIEHNRIYRTMQMLEDGAGIYVSMCKNAVLRGNFVSDIADPTGTQRPAYYLDEQAQDCLVEGNLALRVPVLLNNHMARNNTVRNNVLVADGDAKVTFYRCSDYRLEKNVIYAKGKLLFIKCNAVTAMPNNVIFSAVGIVEGEKMDDSYRKLGRGPLEPRDGTVIADPMFDKIEEGIVTFKPDSPALKLGIQPIDVSRAGRPEK